MRPSVTTFAGACSQAGTGNAPPGGALLDLVVVAGYEAFTAQTYPISGSSNEVTVQYAGDFGSQCAATPVQGGDDMPSSISTKARVVVRAASGTVTFTQVTSTAITGTFDATFPSGDHLAGTFTAPICTATASGKSDC